LVESSLHGSEESELSQCNEMGGPLNGGQCSHRERKENRYTEKKENKIFLIYKEIQTGSGAKSYMTNDLLSPHIW
jgi:hypothetical protein